MVVDKFKFFLKTVFCTFLLSVWGSASLLAGTMVDLNESHNHPLGQVLLSRAGDQVYFSLGNGRAIRFSKAGRTGKGGIMLKRLISSKGKYAGKFQVVKRRNIKW